MSQPLLNRQHRADLALLLLSVVWGSTFPAVKAALESLSPLLLVALRFWVAVLCLVGVAPRRVLSSGKLVWRDGTLLGVLLAAGYLFQTVGLGRTTASRSGFLTSLYVIVTPVFMVLVGKGLPSRAVLLGAAIVLAGVYGMALPDGAPLGGLLETLLSGLSAGDWWTVACAVCFAAYIVLLDICSSRHDILQLTFVQLAVTAGIASVATPLLEVVHFQPRASDILALIYLGSVASLGALLVQTRFQSDTTPARAAIIYSLESVFAAVIASWWLSEQMGRNAWIGAALILAGVIVSELARANREPAPS